MKRAFTLIETIVVVAISAAAFIAMANLFFIFNSIYGYQQAFMAAAGSSGASMNAFELSVLPAEQVLASHNFSGTTHSSGASTLVLELPSINGSGDILSGAKDYVAFYASSTKLYRLTEANAGSARVSSLTQLSSTLLSLGLTYDDIDFTKVTNVIVDIQTQATFKQRVVQSRLREQLYLRNKQPSP